MDVKFLSSGAPFEKDLGASRVLVAESWGHGSGSASVSGLGIRFPHTLGEITLAGYWNENNLEMIILQMNCDEGVALTAQQQISKSVNVV